MPDQPAFLGFEPAPTSPAAGYRVFARKYRPQTFDDLIGQEPMVQTLRNAFAADRIPQAWMLTGVRGVGKTTTARILARALNYDRGDGSGPTTDMPELGLHCREIIESRHIDVLELDAASHTGVDNIRQLTDGVRYGPAQARYKVYIIDEVHMLSTAAFNAFLKTLEEPPPHAKFIFATTEIRKVPVTILSRCQRFDLRRIETGALVAHLDRICRAETVMAEPEALAAIARAAEGSVRDALSLLDQAVAHGGGAVTEPGVRDMLGLADRARVIDLFEAVMKGDVPAAFAILRAIDGAGADSRQVLEDLAQFTHLVTRLKLVPESAQDAALTESERIRGADFANRLSIRVLSRAWQILLKALPEVAGSRRPVATAEMALVRLAYAADLPTPDDALRSLRDGTAHAVPNRSEAATETDTPAAERLALASRQAEPAIIDDEQEQRDLGWGEAQDHGQSTDRTSAPEAYAGAAAQSHTASSHTVPSVAIPSVAAQSLAVQPAQTVTEPLDDLEARPVILRRFEDVVALAGERRDIVLKAALERAVRLVRFEEGHIEIALVEGASRNLPNDLSRALTLWCGRRWVVSVSSGSAAGPTLDEARRRREAERRHGAADHPLVQAVLKSFPGAEIVDVRDRAVEAEPPPATDMPAEPDFDQDM